MKLSKFLLARRGWLRFPSETPESYRLIRYGEIKWRDYQPRELDPPYWYKWTTESPYHPQEQKKIMYGETVNWYKHNYYKLKIIEPDQWLFKVGDKVEILVGKDKGKKGDIVQVVPEGNIIVVGGLNCKREFQEDQLNQVPKPLQHDEVSLLDPVSNNATNVTFKVDSDGQRVRVSDESGHVIPWPPELLPDGTPKREYVFGQKDTALFQACEKTFTPTLEHWEDELGKIFGVNDPPRKETYWY